MSAPTKIRIPSVRMPLAVFCTVFLVAPVLFGVSAVSLGKDVNWDLKNYHYYNGYALLEWRYEADLAPSQLQTYFNPILDAIFYPLLTHEPAWLAGFAVGTIQGFCFSLVFLLAWMVNSHCRPKARCGLSAMIAALACSGPGFISELGTFLHDSTLAVPVLAALGLLVAALQDREVLRLGSIGLAGALLGAAVSLKLTNAVYAVAAAVALAATLPGWRARILGISMFGAVGTGATLLFHGPWSYLLYTQTGNPIFPLLEGVFDSGWGSIGKALVSDKYAPNDFLEILAWPVIMSADSLRVSEMKFVDYRFAIVGILGLAVLLVTAVRPRRNAHLPREANFLLVFALVSFYIWTIHSGIYRYLIALELLVPLVALILIRRLGLPKAWWVGITVALSLMVALTVDPPTWGRREWTGRYFEVSTSEIEGLENALVIMLGLAPMSWVVPEFPVEVRFVRPQSNLSPRAGQGLFEKIKATVIGHRGPTFLLYKGGDQALNIEQALESLDLGDARYRCTALETNMPDDLQICPLSRANETGWAEAARAAPAADSLDRPDLFWSQPEVLNHCGQPGKIRLHWDVKGLAGAVEIRVGGSLTESTLFLHGGAVGSADTGQWVNPGTQFLLVGVESPTVKSGENLLATIRVRTTSAGCSRSRSRSPSTGT